jgi:hypothetical protein
MEELPVVDRLSCPSNWVLEPHQADLDFIVMDICVERTRVYVVFDAFHVGYGGA